MAKRDQTVYEFELTRPIAWATALIYPVLWVFMLTPEDRNWPPANKRTSDGVGDLVVISVLLLGYVLYQSSRSHAGVLFWVIIALLFWTVPFGMLFLCSWIKRPNSMQQRDDGPHYSREYLTSLIGKPPSS